MIPKHPGEILREKLAEQKISLGEAAKITGYTKATLSRLCSGEHALTAKMAVKISILCQCDPLTLLTYQNLYDLARLEGGEQ